MDARNKNIVLKRSEALTTLVLGFVRVVVDATVHVAITLPRLGDTATGRVALEVVGATGDGLAVLWLVRVVTAVVIVVAFPHVWDAFLVGALELVWSTSLYR